MVHSFYLFESCDIENKIIGPKFLPSALTEQKATVRQKNRTGYEVGRCTQKSPPRENTLALRKKYENGVGYMQFM